MQDDKPHPSPSGDNVGYALGYTDSVFTLAPEYQAAEAVKAVLAKAMPGASFDKRAAVAMVAAVLIVGEEPTVRARRGKVINVMTEEFRAMLQRYLPH